MERDRYSGGGFLEVGKAAASFCGKAWRRSDPDLLSQGRAKITVLCGREKREQFPAWNTTILFHMFRAGYRNGCFRLHRKVLVKSCVIFRCGPSFNSFLYCFFTRHRLHIRKPGFYLPDHPGRERPRRQNSGRGSEMPGSSAMTGHFCENRTETGTATAIRWMDHSRCEAGKCMWRDASFW